MEHVAPFRLGASTQGLPPIGCLSRWLLTFLSREIHLGARSWLPVGHCPLVEGEPCFPLVVLICLLVQK